MQKRQVVTWRIPKDPEKEDKLNKWCNSQENIAHSITSIVQNMIEIFGYEDVRSFEVQQVMHKWKNEMNSHYAANNQENQTQVKTTTPNQRVIDNDPFVDNSRKTKGENDIMKAIDTNNDFFK